MANSKITDLASGSPAAASDVFLIARAGVNYKLTAEQVWTVASASQLKWSTDTGLSRYAAAIVAATNGSSTLGSFFTGTLYVGGTYGGGSYVTVTAPSSGVLSVGGTLLSRVNVTANTGTATPAITDSGTLYTNTGDADGSIVTLPNDPTVGTNFRFAVTAAQTLTVNAATGETIQDGASSGTSIVADAVGEWLHLVAVTGGSGAMWMVMGKAGTWTLT